MKLTSWFYHLNDKINEHARLNVHPYMTFAIFGIITYPLYYFIWTETGAAGYENLGMRMIAVMLCIILALNQFWPNRLKQFLPLYWYLTLLYSLPFLFTFLLLKNDLSQVAILNTMTVLVLSMLLLDTITLLIILPIGIGLGTSFFWWGGGQLYDNSNHSTLFITYGSVLFFGVLFSYRKDQLKEAEKRVKQAESKRLQTEIDAKKRKLASQRSFNKTARQVAHDIRSPVASLMMIVKSCNKIPEMERVALREASQRINDIADNLLNHYKPVTQDEQRKNTSQRAMLLSASLLQALREKKFQYKERNITFCHEFTSSGQFSFIYCSLTSFKRMISNLINNSADAISINEGEIKIKLDATKDLVTVTVIDNGEGMSIDMVHAIYHKKEITEGKINGHGIGLSQVNETLDECMGRISIESELRTGTNITLTFPRLNAPSWIAEKLLIHSNNIIIVLDDDRSIHGAWDARLESVLKKSSNNILYHFQKASDAIQAIENFSATEKEKVLLLTDFELVNQDINGLDVIEHTQLKNSYLVTSHFMEIEVQKRAVSLGTQIIPKLLASEIPIEFYQQTSKSKIEKGVRKVDAVLVDDEEAFANSLINYIFADSCIDYFKSPGDFFKSIDLYSKTTRVYMDNSFDRGELKGLNALERLHDMGFEKLYLLSGNSFEDDDIPEYVTVILKTDIDSIKDW